MALDSITPEGEWMKSHVLLLGRILEDVSIQCRTSTTNDMKYVVSRVEDEGLSFLTITLSNFGKDFERCLDRGSVDSTLFQGFRRSGSLPAFLQGLTSQVFDKEDGVLVDNPSIEAIQAVRQVSYLFKKLELGCTDSRVKKAFTDFVNCDREVGVRSFALSESKHAWADFQRMANTLFLGVLSRVDGDVYHGEAIKVGNTDYTGIIPKHGPGATADRIKANAKYDIRVWTERLEEYFPAMDFLYPSVSHFLEDETGPIYLEPGDELPVRVVQVPKTLKSPRIIAIEPTYRQYVQQGLCEAIVNGIEKDDFLHQIIGFTDQEINRTMACHGSASLDLATLDLSEASDRVSKQHVSRLLGSYPNLLKGVMACRGEKADVPGHGIISLNKYASMGSALTFPLEAMVFTTVVFLGIEKALKTQLDNKSIKGFVGKVRVYGDDIIVPVETVSCVIAELETYGFVVNASKSFWTGKFRESCGGDFYDGYDVSVVKAKHEIPTTRKHVQEIRSTVSLRNQLYFAGYWRTADYLDKLLARLIPMPTIHPDSPGLGRHTYLDYEVQRVCPHLQRPLVKAAVEVSKSPHSPVSGVGALLKWFLKRGDEPFADVNHLERAGRPEVLDIKLRWVTPY